MKLVVNFIGEVRNVLEREYITKENRTGKAYKIGVETEQGEMGHIPCTAEVARKFNNGIKKGDMCCFLAEYLMEYNRLWITGVSLMSK